MLVLWTVRSALVMCSESQILTYLACQLGMFNCFGKCKVMGSMYVTTEQAIFLRRGSIPVLSQSNPMSGLYQQVPWVPPSAGPGQETRPGHCHCEVSPFSFSRLVSVSGCYDLII